MRHLFHRDLLSYAVVGLAVCVTVVASLQLAPLFGFSGMPGAVLGGSSDVALPKAAEKRQVASRPSHEPATAKDESAGTETTSGAGEGTSAPSGSGSRSGSGVSSRRDATRHASGGSTTPTGGGTSTTTPSSTATPAPATPATGNSSSAPTQDTTSTPSTVVASASRALRLNLVSVARIASVGNPGSSTTKQGSVALRFAVADASGSAAQGVPAGVSVNVAIPETPQQAPTSEALRVQVEMLDPAAAAAAGTDATPAGVDDVALRVRLALSDAKVEDPVFTQAPAATEGVSNTVNVWVPLDAKGNDNADPVKPVETEAAPASAQGDQPAADTAAQAEVVIPMTTGEGGPASSTQTVPLPVTGEAPPSGEPTGDNATPVVVQVESATEPPAEPPAAPQTSEEQPAQEPEPAATPEPTAPQDDAKDDDCKDDRDAADPAKADDPAASDQTSAHPSSSDDDDDDGDDDDD